MLDDLGGMVAVAALDCLFKKVGPGVLLADDLTGFRLCATFGAFACRPNPLPLRASPPVPWAGEVRNVSLLVASAVNS